MRSHVCVATAIGLVQDFRVPLGMHLDHECRRSLCVEPTHLVLVPYQENLRRARAAARRLLGVGVQLEQAFGGAQDVEGCIVGKDLFVVQTRPQPL